MRGEKGEPGNRGDVGFRGEEGSKGAPGEKGPKGEDGIGAADANKLINEMSNTSVAISNIQKAVEAAENATKKAQELALKVTTLYRQTEISAQRVERSKDVATRSQRMIETFSHQVKLYGPKE